MKCASCGFEYDTYAGDNQHTACPSCGETIGNKGTQDLREKLAEVIDWFESWDQATRTNRELARRDLDYYHGKQWTAAETEILRKRNQPAVVVNRIFKKMNYLLGQEMRNRTDPKALPRTPTHDDDVSAVTDALRYIADAEDYPRLFSQGWKDLLLPGWTGAVYETEVVGDAPASQGGEAAQGIDSREVEVKARRARWDRLWWDPHSLEQDYSDAEYKGVVLWMDESKAIRYFGKKAGRAKNYEQVIREAKDYAQGTSETHSDKPTTWYDSKRKRVRIVEAYYCEDGVWQVCHFTCTGFVVPPRPTGLMDDKGKDTCPLEMTSAFVDEEGNRYGLARHLISLQDEVNKRRSKALHQVSVQQTYYEEGAIQNPQEFRTELAKPDGLLKVERNALSTNRVQPAKNTELAQAQFNLLAESKAEIDSVGPDAPMIGSTSGDASGRAIQFRQQIGSMEIEPVTDPYRRWKRAGYKQTWCRVRAAWTYQKWMRVQDDAADTGYRFVGLNRRTTKGQRVMELVQHGVAPPEALKAVGAPPEALTQVAQELVQQGMPPEQAMMAGLQQLLQTPEAQEPFTAADVAQLDVDIVIDEAPDTAIIQQEEVAELREIGQSMVAAGQPFPLKLYIEASQLRNKKKLLEMIEPKQPDPQQAQMQQLMQQIQATLAQLQVAQAQANVAKTQSEAAENQAQAQKAQAEAELAPVRAQRDIAGAMHDAAKAGAATAPALGHPAA